MQNFCPLKSPMNILVIVLLRKFSKDFLKDFSKDFSKDQNFAPESGPGCSKYVLQLTGTCFEQLDLGH